MPLNKTESTEELTGSGSHLRALVLAADEIIAELDDDVRAEKWGDLLHELGYDLCDFL